jgi:hypothetical protein
VAHETYDIALPEAGTLTLMLDSSDERFAGGPGGGTGENGAGGTDGGVGENGVGGPGGGADAGAVAKAGEAGVGKRATRAKKRAGAKKKELNGLAYAVTLSVPPLCALYYGFNPRDAGK